MVACRLFRQLLLLTIKGCDKMGLMFIDAGLPAKKGD
jgi:hypothetical protein